MDNKSGAFTCLHASLTFVLSALNSSFRLGFVFFRLSLAAFPVTIFGSFFFGISSDLSIPV